MSNRSLITNFRIATALVGLSLAAPVCSAAAQDTSEQR